MEQIRNLPPGIGYTSMVTCQFRSHMQSVPLRAGTFRITQLNIGVVLDLHLTMKGLDAPSLPGNGGKRGDSWA